MPRGDKSAVLLGEPLDAELDVGIAVRNGDEVKVRVFSGSSALSAGSPTDSVESIDRILSPLTMEEVGTIRCIGLNVSLYLYPCIPVYHHSIPEILILIPFSLKTK